MPPAVLADSDDDGDDIAGIECEDQVTSSRGSRANGREGARDVLAGTDEKATSSTEILRRQIQSAEHGLLSNSAPGMNQHNSSASPAKQASKRRHTAAFASEGNASPEKGLKRTKTLKTYGASRRQAEPTDDGDFANFRDDDGHVAATSRSIRFSEHSGHQSSMPLPAGSLQTDFLNHEPAVMFKDTGDTVADASSEQQRLLDQVLVSKKGLSTSLTKEAQAALDQQSSSIPWTVSDIADSAKSRKSQATATAGGEVVDDADGLAGNDDLPKNADIATAEKLVPDADQNGTQSEASQSHKVAEQAQSTSRKPKSSPRVEISRQEFKEAAAEDEGAKPTQRSGKGRNRKVQEESSEPLNSDDRAIGLPKERYQPRLSRRRATQVVEEPIDYSIIPEKAAKVKRTKTAGAKASVSTTDKDELDATQGTKPGVNPPGLSKDGRSEDDRKEAGPASTSKQQTASAEEDDSPVKPRRTIKQHSVEPTVSGAQTGEQSASQEKSKAEAQDGKDKIFVKPAIPTPKPKGSSKAKRAQTTIFEDHVKFGGSLRSPNLSQQQAKRKSALQDVQNEAAPKAQRKRKSVVPDDSDDEDELAKENDTVPEKAKSPPKKRRGRPPKSDKQAQPKANEDSEEDEEHGEQDEAEESEVEEPPKKKRGRGRPAKAASKTQLEDVNEKVDDKKQPDSDRQKQPEKAENESQDPGAPPASTPSKPSAPAAEIPTPSPEKPTEKTKSTPQKATTTSAAQHSPIKSSTKVPLRVGLSKRHRIPPLLRITKPPKR